MAHGLRMVDFRAINYCTSKHAGPLPMVQELLNELGDATHFSCLDLQQGHKQIRIAPGDPTKQLSPLLLDISSGMCWPSGCAMHRRSSNSF